jgi:hypothetical protein
MFQGENNIVFMICFRVCLVAIPVYAYFLLVVVLQPKQKCTVHNEVHKIVKICLRTSVQFSTIIELRNAFFHMTSHHLKILRNIYVFKVGARGRAWLPASGRCKKTRNFNRPFPLWACSGNEIALWVKFWSWQAWTKIPSQLERASQN